MNVCGQAVTYNIYCAKPETEAMFPDNVLFSLYFTLFK